MCETCDLQSCEHLESFLSCFMDLSKLLEVFFKLCENVLQSCEHLESAPIRLGWKESRQGALDLYSSHTTTKAKTKTKVVDKPNKAK